jgi:hypothetical protein
MPLDPMVSVINNVLTIGRGCYSRRKKEEGRRKKEEAVIAMVLAVKNVLTVLAVAIYYITS